MMVTNEIAVLRPLLAPLDLHGTVVTFDALHSQAVHARFLVEEQVRPLHRADQGNQRDATYASRVRAGTGTPAMPTAR
ncbi:hypothetical protein [Streptomyces sp. NPDC088746]|uniref:hypothetical protein n=1 Tax=Streptomyces sp. NPDC088746 TaxID=3365885 RepID=UPI003801BDEE